MRTIGVVTVGRSDFGIYLPVLRAIQKDPDLELRLIVSGAHLSPIFGDTVKEIEAAGFEVDEQVQMLLAADSPVAIAQSMGLGLSGAADVMRRMRPDLLLVLGDRFEMLAFALAAVPFKIPIAHIHGGEVTRGAIDDAFRHSLTKCSHLHFPSTAEHAARIRQLGEEPWRITVSGAPALDNLKDIELLGRDQLQTRLGVDLSQDPLLVTYHPVTLQFEQAAEQIEHLLAALQTFDGPLVITQPNADTNSRAILDRIEEFAAGRDNACLVDNLGTQGYFSLMNIGAAMVGNSSSGIIEAASFQLPVVNVGIRQDGRPRSGNVIDTGNDRAEITAAIAQATSDTFRQRIASLSNIYGNGEAAAQIVESLKTVNLDDSLILKRFVDVASATGEDRQAA